MDTDYAKFQLQQLEREIEVKYNVQVQFQPTYVERPKNFDTQQKLYSEILKETIDQEQNINRQATQQQMHTIGTINVQKNNTNPKNWHESIEDLGDCLNNILTIQGTETNIKTREPERTADAHILEEDTGNPNQRKEQIWEKAGCGSPVPMEQEQWEIPTENRYSFWLIYMKKIFTIII